MLVKITSVLDPTGDNTPTYEYSIAYLDGLGTLDWGGSCDGYFPEVTDSIGASSNVTTATSMLDGVYDECTLTVIDDNTTPDPTNDNTPNYTFSSDEAGTVTYGWDCSSSVTSIVFGNNVIAFDLLEKGTYSNCTITATDFVGNVSSDLNISSFEVNVDITPDLFVFRTCLKSF